VESAPASKAPTLGQSFAARSISSPAALDSTGFLKLRVQASQIKFPFSQVGLVSERREGGPRAVRERARRRPKV